MNRSHFLISLNEYLQEVSRIDDAQYNPKGFLFMQKELSVELTPDIRYILVYSQDSDFDGRTEIVEHFFRLILDVVC